MSKANHEFTPIGRDIIDEEVRMLRAGEYGHDDPQPMKAAFLSTVRSLNMLRGVARYTPEMVEQTTEITPGKTALEVVRFSLACPNTEGVCRPSKEAAADTALEEGQYRGQRLFAVQLETLVDTISENVSEIQGYTCIVQDTHTNKNIGLKHSRVLKIGRKHDDQQVWEVGMKSSFEDHTSDDRVVAAFAGAQRERTDVTVYDMLSFQGDIDEYTRRLLKKDVT